MVMWSIGFKGSIKAERFPDQVCNYQFLKVNVLSCLFWLNMANKVIGCL